MRNQRDAYRSWRESHARIAPRRSTTMNVLTDIVAALAHFIGWLV
ncbi:hypothetical protein ACIQOU_26325 [Streptomyces sp. NPDC091279]